MPFDKLIFSVAYNMTGDVDTAKDVVQDLTLKFLEQPVSENVRDTRNYIIRTTINHCLNLKKKESRIHYTGTWLPEPVLFADDHLESQLTYEKNNLLTYEMAVLVEQLSAHERAVFVLREAFEFDHKEIAHAIQISPEHSRQLYKRAKDKVGHRRHPHTSSSQSLEVARTFISHISQGNIAELIALFNEDIHIIGDGGGKAPAIKQPLFGKEAVAHFYTKIFLSQQQQPHFIYLDVQSQPAIAVYLEGKLVSLQVLSIADNKISTVFGILNPDKLAVFEKNFAPLSHT